MRISDAYTNALAQSMAPKLEHKRSVSSPRLVKVLGADARMATNDEDETVDRGPLPEVSESDWVAFEVERNRDKGQKWHQVNDAAAMDLDRLDAIRKEGL